MSELIEHSDKIWDNILEEITTIKSTIPLSISTDTLTVDIIKDQTGIDLRYLHCQKTGQPVAQMNAAEIDRLLRFYAVRDLRSMASKINIATTISPIWLSCQPSTLERLEEIDPRGFFCYCLGIITRIHHQKYDKQNHSKTWITTEVKNEFHQSLVKSWYASDKLDADKLKKINSQLRIFILLNEHEKRFYQIPWHMAVERQIELPLVEEEKPSQTERQLPDYTRIALGIKSSTGLTVVSGYRNIKRKEATFQGKTLADVVKQSREIDPVWPHNLATDYAIEWLSSYLEKLLVEIKSTIERDKTWYWGQQRNSAFATAKGFKDGSEELAWLMRDVNIIMYGAKTKTEINRAARTLEYKNSGVVATTVEGLVTLKTRQQSKLNLEGLTTKPISKGFKLQLEDKK